MRNSYRVSLIVIKIECIFKIVVSKLMILCEQICKSLYLSYTCYRFKSVTKDPWYIRIFETPQPLLKWTLPSQKNYFHDEHVPRLPRLVAWSNQQCTDSLINAAKKEIKERLFWYKVNKRVWRRKVAKKGVKKQRKGNVPSSLNLGPAKQCPTPSQQIAARHAKPLLGR